jgi:hypothetical protein
LLTVLAPKGRKKGKGGGKVDPGQKKSAAYRKHLKNHDDPAEHTSCIWCQADMADL